MQKYKIVCQNGFFDDFESQNDEQAKSQIIGKPGYGDIILYKYSPKNRVDSWEFIGVKRFLGVPETAWAWAE